MATIYFNSGHFCLVADINGMRVFFDTGHYKKFFFVVTTIEVQWQLYTVATIKNQPVATIGSQQQ